MAETYQKPEFELFYFDGRGLAETSRLLFAYAQRVYVDKRFPLEIIDFATRKFKRDEFDNAKAEGALDLSLGRQSLCLINTKYYVSFRWERKQ